MNKEFNVKGIKISEFDKGDEIARAFLYILKNDLHSKPFGFIEDIFVLEKYRKKGIGKKLVKEIIKTAKENNCYKIICTSRYSKDFIHKFYLDLGFIDHGKEFRLNI